jgi:hypothetical protein
MVSMVLLQVIHQVLRPLQELTRKGPRYRDGRSTGKITPRLAYWHSPPLSSLHQYFIMHTELQPTAHSMLA